MTAAKMNDVELYSDLFALRSFKQLLRDISRIIIFLQTAGHISLSLAILFDLFWLSFTFRKNSLIMITFRSREFGGASHRARGA